MVKTKKAIAMIELIFALVIMGIVLMSAPMLIQQSIKSGNVALQQEAISVTAEKLSWILSLPWDENSNKKIIQIDRTPLQFVPQGLDDTNLRNFDDNKSATAISSLGGDANDSTFDDIDDFHGNSDGLILFNGDSTTSDIGDYVDNNVSIQTTVSYAEDNSSLGGTTYNLNGAIFNHKSIPNISNIKFISVTLTSNSGIDELEKNITLEAFSCNIGTYRIEGNGTI